MAIICILSLSIPNTGAKTLIKYYDILYKKKQEGKHSLNIATIFSYSANEDDADANGFIPEEVSVVEDKHAEIN